MSDKQKMPVALMMLEMLATVMGEEIVLEQAIESLQKYKQEKFGIPTEPIESITLIPVEEEKGSPLASFFDFSEKKVQEEEVKQQKEDKGPIQPMAELTILLLMWKKDAERKLSKLDLESIQVDLGQ